MIPLRGAVVVKDLAEKLGLRPNRLIADLMQLNILASINQRVELDVAQKIANRLSADLGLESGAVFGKRLLILIFRKKLSLFKRSCSRIKNQVLFVINDLLQIP